MGLFYVYVLDIKRRLHEEDQIRRAMMHKKSTICGVFVCVCVCVCVRARVAIVSLYKCARQCKGTRAETVCLKILSENWTSMRKLFIKLTYPYKRKYRQAKQKNAESLEDGHKHPWKGATEFLRAALAHPSSFRKSFAFRAERRSLQPVEMHSMGKAHRTTKDGTATY